MRKYFFVLPVFALFSCGTQPLEQTNSTLDSFIKIYVDVTPVMSVRSGRTTYQGTLWIEDTRPHAQYNGFSNTVATANGAYFHLRDTSYLGNEFVLDSGLVLGEGDLLTVTIKNPVFDTVAGSATVPPACPDFQVYPPLPMRGLPDSCTLRWENPDSNWFSVSFIGYNSANKVVLLYAFLTRFSDAVFSHLLSDSCQYVDICLERLNDTWVYPKYPNTDVQIELRVASTFTPQLTNRP